MYFAVIGDIMSNFCGLQAFFEAMDNEGIHRVIHTGNILSDGPQAMDCIRLLRARNVLCVQGRNDKQLLKRGRRTFPLEEAAGVVHGKPFLDSGAIEYLNNLPRKRKFTEEGLCILVCHGSVNSPNVTLDRTTSRAVYQRQREQEPVDIVISGGALEPYSCLVDNTLFVMPGAMTFASDGVRYSLVDTELWPPSVQTITL